MKKRLARMLWALALVLLAAVLVLANLPRKAAAPAGSQPGEQLPDFSIVCLDGSTFTLSAQRGRVVVINLWATWCTPCVQELPQFDRLQKERGDVAVLALHTPPVTADVPSYLAAFSYTIPFAVDEDGSLSEQLGAQTVLPQTLIVGPDGVVTYNQAGALDYETLTSLVDAAKAP